MKKLFGNFILALLLAGFIACSTKPTPGPDKQGQGLVSGVLVGAGAGAVTGAQVSAATGPGAAIGAGFGAIAGSIRGFTQDQLEEDLLAIARDSEHELAISNAHQTIIENYQRRMELHPARDIYPADLFFAADDDTLKKEAIYLSEEIALLNLYRFPWSRLIINSYVKSSDLNSDYARHLARTRAESIANVFIQMGYNPRRVEARSVIIPAPILIDPFDNKDRFSQAVEFIALDR